MVGDRVQCLSDGELTVTRVHTAQEWHKQNSTDHFEKRGARATDRHRAIFPPQMVGPRHRVEEDAQQLTPHHPTGGVFLSPCSRAGSVGTTFFAARLAELKGRDE